MKNWLKLVICIAVTLSVGISGSFFTTPEIDHWFKTIRKPEWNPPNWLFGPVWTILYVLMGIALYLIWTAAYSDREKRKAVLFFIVQLTLNWLWTFFFFHLHDIKTALWDILLLWLFINLTIFAFGRINKRAAWLLVPYVSWVSFATILNYTIWRMN